MSDRSPAAAAPVNSDRCGGLDSMVHSRSCIRPAAPGRTLARLLPAIATLGLALPAAGGALTVHRADGPTRATGTLAHQVARAVGAGAGRVQRSFPDLLLPTSPDGAAPSLRSWSASNRAARAPASGSAQSGSVDTFRVALVRIEFRSDRGGALSTGSGRFDLTRDTLAAPVDPPPHDRAFFASHLEALRRYCTTQSYGHAAVRGEVWPDSAGSAYSLSDMADFGPWRSGPDLYPAAVRLFRSMLFAADSQSTSMGHRIPWDRYDRIILVHAGSDLQDDVLLDSPEDIPTFTIGVSGNDVVVFPDSANRPISLASIVPETGSQDGHYAALNGVMAHEAGHNLFGLVDAYNVDTGYPVVGLWSLMDSGYLAGAVILRADQSGVYVTGLLPPSVDPLNRAWITGSSATEAVLGQTFTLIASEQADDVRRVTLSPDEYLLIENRSVPAGGVVLQTDSTTHVVLGPVSPDGNAYDALLPGGGVLIWHVDDTWMSSYALNVDPSHYGLRLFEGDGLQDIGNPGSPYFLGAPTDPWFQGGAVLLDGWTTPRLRTNLGTDPQRGVKVLDPAQSSMRVLVAAAPQVQVQAPNGSDGLTIGSTATLQWSASAPAGILYVKLELSRDLGATWETLVESIGNVGAYPWHVTAPSTQGASALLRVVATDGDGIRGGDQSDQGFPIVGPIGVAEAPPLETALGQVAPNPSTGGPVRIAYTVGQKAPVTLSILDVQGRVRAVLTDAVLFPGRYEALWPRGEDFAPGIYFIRYAAASRIQTRRMVVVR